MPPPPSSRIVGVGTLAIVFLLSAAAEASIVRAQEVHPGLWPKAEIIEVDVAK